MTCFYKFATSNQQLICDQVRALREFANTTDGAFTPVELKKEVCDSSNCETLSQCPAFNDIQAYGKASGWVK